MPILKRASVSGTADAAGLLTLTFQAPPWNYRDVYAITTKCQSSGGSAECYVGSFLVGYLQAVDQGWARGFIAEQGNDVQLRFAGLLVGDFVQAFANINEYDTDEDIGAVSFEGSPVSSAAPDSTFIFGNATTVTTLVNAPGLNKFIRVLGASVGISSNAERAAAGALVLQLEDGGGTPIAELMNPYVPATGTANATELPGATMSPWISFGKGRDCAPNTALRLRSTAALTQGQAFAVVEFVIIG